MGYLHIDNLYKSQDILLFKECYAMEKIHGTSAHIVWKDSKIRFFSGGEKYDKFVALFNEEKLTKVFLDIGQENVIIYGEAYAGKQQGMSQTYGKDLKFIVFDVRVGENWLNVPQAEEIANKLGLEFVHYEKISTNMSSIDTQRDDDSVQAIRNGMGEGKIREGIVLRPLIEVTKNNGERIIAKHKRDEFKERGHSPKIVDKDKLEVLTKAKDIAEEWVTFQRLEHVLQKLPHATSIEHIGEVIKAMVEDVYREAKNEIVENKDVSKSIGKKTVELFKKKFHKL